MRTRWNTGVLRSVLLGAAVLACTGLGCARDRLSYDKYDLIQPRHMTQADVENLIGEPSSRAGNQWIYDRFDKSLNVVVTFDQAGMVARKQWVDPGRWDDSAGVPKN